MAADFMREVWAAAGGFPDAFPTAPGAERSVLALVRQVRAVAATVENPLAALGRDYAIDFGKHCPHGVVPSHCADCSEPVADADARCDEKE